MAEDRNTQVSMETIVSLCKRRGFIFQSSEIYGGLGGFWDYGPLGVELKNNIKRAWWRANVQERDDMVGLDSAILMNPLVWQASGHLQHFADPMVDCRECKHRFRADDLELAYVQTTQGEIEIDTSVTATVTGLPIYPQNSLAVSNIKLSPKFKFSDYQDLIQDVMLESVEFNRPISGTAEFPTGTGYFAFDLGSLPVPAKSVLVLSFVGGSTPLRINVSGPTVNPVNPNVCPDCGAKGSFTEARMFNMMFKTFVGPVEEDASVAYLRPETAQGIFVNFDNVLTATRKKLPFGIAQIGKAFRNEITPGNFTFRSREFEQMEIEFFVRPGTDEEWHRRWIQERLDWYARLGIDPAHLSLHEHPKEELSHYSKGTTDIMYRFPMGWSELEGVANRTDFDLTQHAQSSGQRLTYFDEEAGEPAYRTGRHIVPYVIEPSAGVDRSTLAFLLDAYREEEALTATGGTERRVVLRLHKSLAPIKVAVLPLSRNEQLFAPAQEVYALLRKQFMAQYDDAQSIGRRYRRQDEIGTPLCVTIDFDTLTDRAVTIRDRDTMEQVRIPIAELVPALRERLED